MTNLKKYLLAGAVIAFVLPHAAHAAANNDNNNFTGPYVGGEVGYDWGSFKTGEFASDGRADVDGVEGGPFAGYGTTFPIWGVTGYAAAELGYEWSGADGDAISHSFDKKHEFLATFRPGIQYADRAVGYGIIGYGNAKFDGAGDSDNLNGLVLGLGTQLSTGTPVKARLEWTYKDYENVFLSNVNFDGHENDLKLGLLYQFN